MYYAILSDIERVHEVAMGTGEVPPSLDPTIETWDLDEDFKRSFQLHWFAETLEVGPTMFPRDWIRDREKEEGNLSQGLLVIGAGPNGDALVLKASDLSIWFWDHEDADDHENFSLDDCVPLYDHILILLLHIHNRDFIPWDSYAARDYHEIMNGK